MAEGQEGISSWKELLDWGIQCLAKAGIPEQENDAWLLLEAVSGMDRAAYFLHCRELPGSSQCQKYREIIAERSRRIPLQYLTGIQEFMGFPFQVGPEVLIPRQDTELLVELALPLVSGKRILDLCTGSGCIAISLALLGRPAQIEGIDLSCEALETARRNAANLGADVTFRQNDLLLGITEEYDVIVSNPPYISREVIPSLMPEVKDHEPVMALDGGGDGLDFYRRIAREGKAHLSRDGILAVEIGYDQREAVTQLFQEAGYRQIRSYKDLAGMDRAVTAVRR